MKNKILLLALITLFGSSCYRLVVVDDSEIGIPVRFAEQYQRVSTLTLTEDNNSNTGAVCPEAPPAAGTKGVSREQTHFTRPSDQVRYVNFRVPILFGSGEGSVSLSESGQLSSMTTKGQSASLEPLATIAAAAITGRAAIAVAGIETGPNKSLTSPPKEKTFLACVYEQKTSDLNGAASKKWTLTGQELLTETELKARLNAAAKKEPKCKEEAPEEPAGQ